MDVIIYVATVLPVVFEVFEAIFLENATEGCKSPCPSGGVQNIILGDPLY